MLPIVTHRKSKQVMPVKMTMNITDLLIQRHLDGDRDSKVLDRFFKSQF